MDDPSSNITAITVDAAAAAAAAAIEHFLLVLRLPWQIGIGVSCLCLALQALLLALVPGVRKHDQLVLAQLTAARVANTACEYCIVMYVVAEKGVVKDVVFGLYTHTDFVLVCWMFVFSNNLYDKVVVVFPARGRRGWCAGAGAEAALVWALGAPPAALFLVLINLNVDYFHKFYTTYALVKFLIASVNASMFVDIFSVAYRRGARGAAGEGARGVCDAVRCGAAACALVCLTSAQVLVTDLLSLVWGEHERLAFSFCVVNSFQPVLVTAIFVVLSKSKLRDSIRRTASLRLTEVRKL